MTLCMFFLCRLLRFEQFGFVEFLGWVAVGFGIYRAWDDLVTTFMTTFGKMYMSI